MPSHSHKSLFQPSHQPSPPLPLCSHSPTNSPSKGCSESDDLMMDINSDDDDESSEPSGVGSVSSAALMAARDVDVAPRLDMSLDRLGIRAEAPHNEWLVFTPPPSV